MRKVLKNSKDTRSSLETLAEDNRESFQDSRIDFSKKYLPAAGSVTGRSGRYKRRSVNNLT